MAKLRPAGALSANHCPEPFESHCFRLSMKSLPEFRHGLSQEVDLAQTVEASGLGGEIKVDATERLQSAMVSSIWLHASLPFVPKVESATAAKT